jgi:hypothetical protein
MTSNFTYTTGIPNGPDNPSNDQPIMQTNTNSINSLIDTDHIGFNTNFGGAHNQVQMPFTASGVPSGLFGIGFVTLYSKIGVTVNEGELWFVRAAGTTGIQLTGPGGTSTLTNNYAAGDGSGPTGVKFNAGNSFLPGALIYQYGFYDNGAGGISPSIIVVKFPVLFISPTSIVVTITAISKVGGTTESHTASLISGTVTTAQFQVNFDTSTASYRGFTWTAVGN